MRVISISAIWCSSCLLMKKNYQKVKKEFQNLEWIDYDLDFDIEASHYQVGEKLPVLIFEKDQVEQSRLVGEKKVEEIIKWLEENIAS